MEELESQQEDEGPEEEAGVQGAPPDVVVASTPTPIPPDDDGGISVCPEEVVVVRVEPPIPKDQNANDVKKNGGAAPPQVSKGLEPTLEWVRKVSVLRKGSSTYSVLDESGLPLLETVEDPSSAGASWLPSCIRRRRSGSQRVLDVRDPGGGVSHMTLDFGKRRWVTCCQALRFASISGGGEAWGVVFKDVGCCVVECCSGSVSWEGVAQGEGIVPFTVGAGRKKAREELMVKGANGGILAFIDKERGGAYTLTMGEGLKVPSKAFLIAFIIIMDVLEREEGGCYVRASSYVTLLFLLCLMLMISAFLYHFLTAMVLAWPRPNSHSFCADPHPPDDSFPLSPPPTLLPPDSSPSPPTPLILS